MNNGLLANNLMFQYENLSLGWDAFKYLIFNKNNKKV